MFNSSSQSGVDLSPCVDFGPCTQGLKPTLGLKSTLTDDKFLKCTKW